MTGIANALVGTWQLASYEVRPETGVPALPLGDGPVGYLHYEVEGFMAAHLMARARVPLGDSASAVDGVARQVMATHFSYCGQWEVEGDTVIHRVAVSVSPDWVGTTQRRHVSLEGDRLTLRAPNTRFRAVTGIGVLVWQRMHGAFLPGDA